MRQENGLHDLARHGVGAEQWHPPPRAEADPEAGPGQRREGDDVHDLVQAGHPRRSGRARPVEQHQVDDERRAEQRGPQGRPLRHSAGAVVVAATAIAGTEELPVSRTALLTAAATVLETSGWNTLGTM